MSNSKPQGRTRLLGSDGNALLESEDAVYRALASERRRHVLSVLENVSLPIAVTDLARAVAIREAADTSALVTEESITQVHISLYHNHLPMLEDVDLIGYDNETETVDGVAAGVGSILH